MKLLSQRDLEWASHTMGASTLTLGRWGCTTTCISMLSDYFGDYKSPLELAANVHNYTPDGLILWWNIKFDKMQFVKRVRGTTSHLMPEILEALKDPDQGVLLQVNDGAHWVLAYSTKLFSKDLAVADPWVGKVVPCLKTYKNITGAAYYRRVPTDEVIKKQEDKPVIEIPSKKLIKGADSPHIYYYNGKNKFKFPNWYTFVEFGGDMSKVEVLADGIVDRIESGKAILSIKP